MTWLCITGNLLILFFINIYKKYSKVFPLNCILYLFFTLTLSYVAGSMGTVYDTNIVLEITLITLIITISLSLYSILSNEIVTI